MTAIALAPFPALSGGANYPDVRVIESTESGITFEFIPKYELDGKILSDGREYQTVRFERSSEWDYANAGKPDIRFRSVVIGVHGRTGNRLTIVGSDFETLTGFSLAPVPTLVGVTEKNPEGRLYKPAGNESSAFYPSSVVIQRVAKVKGVFVSYLKIFPVQYNSATKTLKKYSRIVVRVDFGPGGQTTASAGDDDWMRFSFLNYSVAKTVLRSTPFSLKRRATNSALASGSWYKLEVRDDGMYKIDLTYLRALGIHLSSDSLMTDLKIYGGNGQVIPADLQAPRQPDLTPQAALYVDVNHNSRFDPEDYILFYGQGMTGWTYSSGAGYTHYTNPYTNSNAYFLQYSPGTGPGTQMIVASGPASGARMTRTVGKVFFDEERTNVTESGLEWYSAPLNSNDIRVITNKLDGYVPNTFVNYKYEMLSRSDAIGVFTIEETGNQIGSLSISGSSSGTLDDGQSDFANRESGSTRTVPALVDSRSTLRITYNDASAIATGYINWVELTYTQQLTAVNNALLFTSPDTTGSVDYEVTGFSGANFAVFDITDLFNVKRISFDSDQVAGTYMFRDNLTSGTVKRYWVGTASAYKTPVSFTRIPNTNLRGGISGADFVIITQHDFLSEAQRLQTYREPALKTMVVEVDTIYNEFGNGLPDPVAIRDFLSYATTQWTLAPRYVLYFGDASYDYKNILGAGRNWVPTYETPESDYQIFTYGYDDFYAYLEPGDVATVTLAQGRIPVRSIAEARLAVDRIIQYESSSPFGAWKNLITITSDDRDIDGQLDAAENPEQAESLSTFVPRLYNVRKIYEDDYPTVIASTGRTKPEVRQAILDQVNAGTLVLNYTGHGNPKVWSHESILTKDDVINQFTNQNRLTFIVAATCDWGRYDEADIQSSAEEALRNSRGGAIAVVSADRAVYSSDNAATNYALYRYLFPTDLFSHTPRLGDALMMAKNDLYSGATANNRKYHLLGDPTLRLAIPNLVMQIDSIDGSPVSATSFDTLRALGKVRISASVRDNAGTVQNITSDSALVTVYDSDRIDSTFDSEPKVMFSFKFLKPGATIYNGENTIHGGRLSATFVVPKDISYENKQGKVSVYFSGGGTDGRGYTDRVIVGGTASVVANDIQGPVIQIFFDSRSFRSGDLVNDNPLLIVDLADSSGINSAGSSVGHRIEAWLDADSKSIDLTANYKGAKDNYQVGSVEYQLEGLALGQHNLRVRAWDVFNNSSTSQTEFSVASSTALALQNVYNIPNPVRSTTTFTFQHNQLSPVFAEIKVYTVSGRLIQVIPGNVYSDRFVKIFWDCHDRDGSKLGNGTYFYKVIAKTLDGKFSSEALGKLSIVR